MGSQYPIIYYNGNINYKKGTVKTLMVSDECVNTNQLYIKNEKQLRERVLSFLTNKKPKILKDFSGNFICVSIIGQPQINPLSNNNGLYEVSFEWVEIDNAENYINQYFLTDNNFVSL